jgi:glycerol-3-phosphate dehydrogenase
VLDTEDFYIDRSEKVPHFIQVAGIQSPGLTASPAIGEYVKDLLKTDGLMLVEKTRVIRKLPPRREIRRETPEGLAGLHAADPRWTHVVCRCENISEAEIVEAIHKGHTTVDGIKFYTRAGMGRCQGGFCTAKILKIISRETGIPMEELTKKGGNSRLLAGRLENTVVDPMPEK